MKALPPDDTVANIMQNIDQQLLQKNFIYGSDARAHLQAIVTCNMSDHSSNEQLAIAIRYLLYRGYQQIVNAAASNPIRRFSTWHQTLASAINHPFNHCTNLSLDPRREIALELLLGLLWLYNNEVRQIAQYLSVLNPDHIPLDSIPPSQRMHFDDYVHKSMFILKNIKHKQDTVKQWVSAIQDETHPDHHLYIMVFHHLSCTVIHNCDGDIEQSYFANLGDCMTRLAQAPGFANPTQQVNTGHTELNFTDDDELHDF